ncbi:MAG: hypothetical protein O7G30_18735, partial [Proteobacteria bacterium]|nr:hypothetical protein [Pseudomonadota bacterium]
MLERARRLLVSLPVLIALAAALPASAQRSFVAFESGHVRPLALDGTLLYVVNTPDNHLEIFQTSLSGLTRIGSVQVGMEPVSVAVAVSQNEVWVVNHLSDSVSIVDVSVPAAPKVTRTLLVGDEPRDIVFAQARAFITTAHRGQHRTHASISGVTGAGDPQLTTAGVSRADIWVFDAASPGAGFGGTPLEIIELFGDTPRALATDGSTVYAAIFHSGNQTAVVSEGIVCDGFGAAPCAGDGVTSPNGLGGGNLPGGNPGPSTNHEILDAPEVGLVVQYDNTSGEWRDEGGRNWSNGIRFTLLDLDVFAIDATTLNETANFDHVGTILFNMAVNPVNGNLYVTNVESPNLTRFEGPGTFGPSPTTVQGHLSEARITVIEPGSGTMDARHLNKHIDYGVLPAP